MPLSRIQLTQDTILAWADLCYGTYWTHIDAHGTQPDVSDGYMTFFDGVLLIQCTIGGTLVSLEVPDDEWCCVDVPT